MRMFNVSYFLEVGILSTKKSSGPSVLKQIFDGHIEDTITDEQIFRILEPVLRRIRDGAFDRRRTIFGKLFQKRAV